MLSLCFITGISARMKFDDIFSGLVEGMSKMAGMFLLFVLLDTFLDMVYLGGGFEALSEILNAIIGKGGRIALMIVGSFVGAFGVEGAAVAQIKITHELFAKSVEAIELPMEMWAIALIAASRITSSVYPTANMIGQMGIARSKNLKAMLVGGWAVSIAALLYIFFWSFLGFNIFF
jgi:Na+/H+ antiporter NhaC